MHLTWGAGGSELTGGGEGSNRKSAAQEGWTWDVFFKRGDRETTGDSKESSFKEVRGVEGTFWGYILLF